MEDHIPGIAAARPRIRRRRCGQQPWQGGRPTKRSLPPPWHVAPGGRQRSLMWARQVMRLVLFIPGDEAAVEHEFHGVQPLDHGRTGRCSHLRGEHRADTPMLVVPIPERVVEKDDESLVRGEFRLFDRQLLSNRPVLPKWSRHYEVRLAMATLGRVLLFAFLAYWHGEKLVRWHDKRLSRKASDTVGHQR